jgi:threonine dehydratase
VHRTPLLSSRTLGERSGTRLFVKAESLQKTGSFKVRGAFNRIRMLSPAEREAGVIAVSAGNHAQALAFAAATEGVACTVVMPASASPSKAAATRAYGGNVVLHGDVFEAFAQMDELRAAHGYTLVHPFDDEGIIAGQGTVGLEILEDLPDVDAVIVPVGGGGLLSGVATAVRALRPAAKVIGVEPEGAAGLGAALREGKVVRLDRISTVADGLAPPMTGERVLEHVRAYVDDVVTVTDAEIREALVAFAERARLVIEPSGAAGLAALLSRRLDLPAGARVVVVASGGNIDSQRLKEVLP